MDDPKHGPSRTDRPATPEGGSGTATWTSRPLERAAPESVTINSQSDGRGYYQRVRYGETEVEVGGFKSAAELDDYLSSDRVMDRQVTVSRQDMPARWVTTTGIILALAGLWQVVMWLWSLARMVVG